jgi:hypothetical protein
MSTTLSSGSMVFAMIILAFGLYVPNIAASGRLP